MHNDQLIYTEDVYIVRDIDASFLKKPVDISVGSMAAIRRPQLYHGGSYGKRDKDIMRNKIKMLLQTAHFHNHNVLVLGAWGCGAFRNPADEVAELFRDVIENDFKNAFDVIVFAVLEFGKSTPLNDSFNYVFNE